MKKHRRLSEAVELARIKKALRDCPTPILSPKNCIKKAADTFGNSLAVACSFGSCSVAVLHMALQIKPDIKVVFHNSVPSYSPIIIKDTNGFVDVLSIEDFWNQVDSPLISTNKGEEIKKIQGYRIFSGTRSQTWPKIKHIIRHNYLGSLVKVNTVSGLVDVSPSHSLIKRGGVVADAKNIKIGDRLAMPELEIGVGGKGCHDGFFVGSTELAWLYGFFAAEGCVTRRLDVKLSNQNTELLEKVKSILEGNFHVSTWLSGPDQDGTYTISCSSKFLNKYLRKLFYTAQGRKKVPKAIVNAPRKVKASFLDGYFCGDGSHRQGNVVGFSSNSQTLTMGILWLIKNISSQTFGVTMREGKPTINDVWLNKGTQKRKKSPRAVKKITRINYHGLLYDLETKDHAFCTGIGPIRVRNTGVQYPETYAYRDVLLERWDLNPGPQFIETKPIKSFWQCIKEYGFPLEVRKGRQSRPKCCLYLKEYPMREACRTYGIEATITGLRASESRARMFAIGQRGQFYKPKSQVINVWKFHPISFWTRKDVFDYFSQSQIPMNPAYEKYALDRLGCVPCTGHKDWRKQMASSNPALYRYIQRLRGVSLISDYITMEEKAIERSCGDGLVPKQSALEEWF